jgi:phosphopantothenoylcysteine decarboxylase/phosphopantothenate--cysteine ligase
MKCIVTAGPTYEPLDRVRRITNFSTGRLGTELANFLVKQGHEVLLLVGEMATWGGPRVATQVRSFSTTEKLAAVLQEAAAADVGAVFHAAAVSDFAVGKTFQRAPTGELNETKAGKIGTREGSLFVEFVPTPKVISNLRKWFPNARLVGWKYEVDGERQDTIAKARQQIADCRTDACVANGPAYGLGFGLVQTHAEAVHYRSMERLFEGLHQLLLAARS